jgi:rare lipoprotein A
VPARIIDVSRAAAEQLDMIVTGTAPVTVVSIDRIVVSTPAVIPVQTPVNQTQIVSVPAAVNLQPAAIETFVQQPALRLTPQINIMQDKTYRLQIGSYRVARNAVETFERLKNSGLNPAYERFTNGDNVEFYRVVVAGVQGNNITAISERIIAAGYREAIIREEN